MTLVKICGFTRPEDARAAVTAGADWLGLNFWPGSKRHISGASGRVIAAAARQQAAEESRDLALVGIFVDQPLDEVAAIAGEVGLEWVQVHGGESPETCAALAERGVSVGFSVIRALGISGPDDVARLAGFRVCQVVLIDTPSAGRGGSGRTFDWNLACDAVAQGRELGQRVILAGGLNPDNVADAVVQVRPHGVDVASGVEVSPGVKDPDRMKRFVERARAAVRAGVAG